MHAKNKYPSNRRAAVKNFHFQCGRKKKLAFRVEEMGLVAAQGCLIKKKIRSHCKCFVKEKCRCINKKTKDKKKFVAAVIIRNRHEMPMH